VGDRIEEYRLSKMMHSALARKEDGVDEKVNF
jgi:hypothetical protein